MNLKSRCPEKAQRERNKGRWGGGNKGWRGIRRDRKGPKIDTHFASVSSLVP